MAFTYDPATPAGKVRLLAIDTLESDLQFQDSEIQAFLDLQGGNVLLAAAAALDTSAATIARVQGNTKFAGIALDGSKAAVALANLAGELRRQCYEGDDGSGKSPIDWAEMVVDPFSYRDRLVSEMLRQST
jgi:hypothetical protein